jgi:hypothetical protein
MIGRQAVPRVRREDEMRMRMALLLIGRLHHRRVCAPGRRAGCREIHAHAAQRGRRPLADRLRHGQRQPPVPLSRESRAPPDHAEILSRPGNEERR